jgi:hypothetical protein
LKASDARARVLETGVAETTTRVPTDGRNVIDLATEIVALTGWSQ